MIVVSDTLPLTNLAAIGQFDLLRQLYGELHIPEGVWEELNARGQPWPGSVEVERAEWIYQPAVQNYTLVAVLQRDLDQGEAEGLALVLELHTDLILMDEQEGRRAAQRLGFRTVGVLGILLDAKAHNVVDVVLPHLDALRQTAGFYLSDDLYQSTLALAGER